MAFPGTGKIWMNGKLVEWKDATIHIASHVIHYGSGVFEGARCYDTPKGSACFRLDAHMRRLQRLGQDLPDGVPARSAPAGSDAVLETIRANEMKACYIRPLVYRGYDSLGVNPLPCPVDAAIMVWDWGAYLGQEALEEGRRREDQHRGRAWRRTRCRRWPRATANYANSALIKMEALADGYSEGIALDVSGNVSEGSGQNIFIVRDGVIYTPPLGIVDPRRHHARLDHDAGARPRLHGDARQMLPRELLYIADEVFFVGTAAEVTPIRSIDKIKIGTRPPRAGHRGAAAGVLRRHQRRGARHARLADLRLSRGEPPLRTRPPKLRRRDRCRLGWARLRHPAA